MAEDSTTRMRVDLSELKKEFKDAQRQIQLVNSEFKAATAGMAKWADDADGVSAKIEQLNGVLAAENVKLQSLEDQYKLVAQEQGENSRGAQELLIRINNQKAAIERTQAALAQYGDRLENLQSESRKAAAATEQLQSKISDQQTELDSLKNKYTDLVLEQGESSDEAKQLASEIQELSQELRQNKQKLEQATQAAGNLGEELDNAGDGAEDSAGGFTVLKGALADLVADGIKEAVSAIKELAADAQEAYAGFRAQTGASADEMREFKHEMDDLYANNYGESLQDIGDKMAYVKQVTGETDPSKIRDLVENAITLEDTFGSDFNETIRGASNLMQHFGLDTSEAFDLFAKGSQEGLDYTDELGDNIAEYGGNFKQAGYSAQEYFQLLKNGTKGGAYNLDKVNDSINEIKNRLADGTIGDTMAEIDEKTGELKDGTGIWSKTTEKAFKAWQKGKGKMKDVIDSIVSDISNCKDEQEALTMASTAFGTMGEDANLNVVKSLTTLGEDFTDVKGKMEEVKNVKYDTVASSLETIKRGLTVNVVEPIVGPVLSSLLQLAQWFPKHIPEIVTLLASVGTAMLVFNAGAVIAKTTAKIALLTGSTKAKEKRETYQKIKDGEVDIVIGTHAVIQDKVEYNKLALVITDEQHRFGVRQRESLSLKGEKPHVLVMSATPIPRTLAIILYGDLDVSIIDELPAERLPIKNCVVNTSYRPTAYRFIEKQVSQGRQVYIICPMVEESETMEGENVIQYAQMLRSQFAPSVRISYLHGKMKAVDKQKVMDDFSEGKIDVLVSTTVVEVGVNVPNATVMMVENAERFGLAQLHQLRGRVGRGKYQSYCIFVTGNKSKKIKDRLDILQYSNDGFKIAEEDLKQRGPGDFFGVRQSGDFDFGIADVFTDAKTLKEASDAAKEMMDSGFDIEDGANTYLKEKVDDYTRKCLEKINL